jgi:hypothetical protein
MFQSIPLFAHMNIYTMSLFFFGWMLELNYQIVPVTI